MRISLLAMLVCGLMLMPNVSAGATFNDVIPAATPVVLTTLPFFGPVLPQPIPLSTPVVQSYDQLNVVLNRGDIVTATLTYADTSGGQFGGNDLDLTVLLPSAAPIPVVVPPTPDFVVAVATSRITRATCADTIAESDNKPAAGEGFAESVSFAVPGNGEQGSYALIVRGFLVTTDQPYSLTVSVEDGNGRGDVTASRVTPVLTSSLITTNPHCELL